MTHCIFRRFCVIRHASLAPPSSLCDQKLTSHRVQNKMKVPFVAHEKNTISFRLFGLSLFCFPIWNKFLKLQSFSPQEIMAAEETCTLKLWAAVAAATSVPQTTTTNAIGVAALDLMRIYYNVYYVHETFGCICLSIFRSFDNFFRSDHSVRDVGRSHAAVIGIALFLRGFSCKWNGMLTKPTLMESNFCSTLARTLLLR